MIVISEQYQIKRAFEMNLTRRFCVILTDVYTVHSLKNQGAHLNCKLPTL